MLKATQHNLKKAETVFKGAGYRVRYGKGNFQAGMASLDDKRNIVINRLFTVEARMNCLIELLNHIELDTSEMEEAELNFLEEMKKAALQNESSKSQ